MTNLLYILPLYAIPFGYLFIPFGHLPLWLLSCLPLLHKPFARINNKTISLFLLLIPLYSLLLSFLGSKYIPLGHLLALFTPFFYFSVYNFLIRKLSLHRVVIILSNCFLIAILILFIDIFLPSELLSSPYIVGFSGLGSNSFPQNRFAGSFTEPGHFGVLLNFLQPFFFYRRINRPFFKFFAFGVPLLVLNTIGSAPSFLCSLLCSFIFLFPEFSSKTLVNFSTSASSLFKLKLAKTSVFLLISFPLTLYFLGLSSRYIGYFSALISGTSTGDILSAGNRAARVRYVLGEIWQYPFGSGIAPNWKVNQLGGEVTLDRATGDVFAVNVDSSISSPIDLAWFAGIPFLLISICFIVKSIFHTIKFISLCQDSSIRLLLLTALWSFVSMIFRFSFVNNYYFPFLVFSLSFLMAVNSSIVKAHD